MRRVLSLVHAAPATALEHWMSAAEAPGDPFCPATSAGLDDREEFPTAACAALDRFGLSRYYVPVQHGGLLAGQLTLMSLLRTVARRDLTVAVAHGKTYLGSVPVWLTAEPDQCRRLAEQVIHGTAVAWGLTERAHGSDLLAGEVTARRDGDGWRLDGAKELINNATRADVVCVLARTADSGGPRGFTVFLADKRTLAAGEYRCLPKEPTHGVRGADISGIEFRDARLPDSARVGDVGAGFEIVLQSLQLTRLFATGLSVGAADHTLRLAARFARERRLYGRTLADLPRVRRTLGEIALAVLLVEPVWALAGRSAQTLPGELSVISAIAKAFIPGIVQQAVDDAAELLGARGFLTGVFADGAFAKLERDHRIVGIFDGSTMVNRSALIEQFPRLTRGWAGGCRDAAGVSATAALATDLGELDTGALALVSRNGCGIVQCLPETLRRVQERVARGWASPQIAELAQILVRHADRLHQEMAMPARTRQGASPHAFRLAERYEYCFAGAASLLLWLHNTPQPGTETALWRDALWLRACLARVLRALGEDAPEDLTDDIADIVLSQPELTERRLFSLFPGADAAAPVERDAE